MSDAFTEQLREALSPTYEVVRELTGGGMSRVFLAHEVQLGRSVVVKLLKPDLAAGVNRDRFRREMLLAAQLHHPHIVPVLTAGQHGEMLWYTMPFVEGESLREALHRTGAFSVRESVRVLHDVLDALAYAHRNGVIHRDIKPGNILRHGSHALVADFGVAKALSAASPHSGSTSIGVAIGTPAYMAPEQIAADPTADHRMDLYAVGLLAYELLTGAQPFNEPSPQETMAAQLSRMPRSLSDSRPEVPEELAALVMQLLSKRPDDRPRSAEVALDRLEAFTARNASTSTGVPASRSTSSQSGEAVPIAVAPAKQRRTLAIVAGLGVVAVVVVAALVKSNPGSTAVGNSAQVQPDSATTIVVPAESARADSLRDAAAGRAGGQRAAGGMDLDSLQRALVRAYVDSAMREARKGGSGTGGTGVAGSATSSGRNSEKARVGGVAPTAAAPRRAVAPGGTPKRVALFPVRDATTRPALAPAARALEDSLRRAIVAAGFTLADDGTLLRLLSLQESRAQRALADSNGIGAILTPLLTTRADELFAQTIVLDVWRNRTTSERQGTDVQNPNGVLGVVDDVMRGLERVSWRTRADARRILVFDFENQTGMDSLGATVRTIADSIRAGVARLLSVGIERDSAARATVGVEERRAVGNRLGAGAMVTGTLLRARADSVTLRLSVRDMSEERTMPSFEIRVPIGAIMGSVPAFMERLNVDLAQVNWGPKASSPGGS